MTTSTIPVWHSETSQSHNRGRNVCIELGVNIFGVMLAYWYAFIRIHIHYQLNVFDRVDYGLRNSTSGLQWRFPLVSAFKNPVKPPTYPRSVTSGLFRRYHHYSGCVLARYVQCLTAHSVADTSDPESPRWLASKDRFKEAEDALMLLDRSPSPEEKRQQVSIQLDSILEAINAERAIGSSSFADCFRNGHQRFFHRVVLGCGSQMMQQLGGIKYV
jgi:hypothetical protein